MKVLYCNVIEANKHWGAEVFLDAAFRQAGNHVHNVDYRVHRNELVDCLEATEDFDIFLLQRGEQALFVAVHLNS